MDHNSFMKRAGSKPHWIVTAGVVQKNGRILITQRPEKGLLGGLWEFPGGKKEEEETLASCLARELKEELGITVQVGRPLLTIPHAYTHFRITLHTFLCSYGGGRTRKIGVKDFRWVEITDLRKFPFSRADLRIVEFLEKGCHV